MSSKRLAPASAKRARLVCGLCGHQSRSKVSFDEHAAKAHNNRYTLCHDCNKYVQTSKQLTHALSRNHQRALENGRRPSADADDADVDEIDADDDADADDASDDAALGDDGDIVDNDGAGINDDVSAAADDRARAADADGASLAVFVFVVRLRSLRRRAAVVDIAQFRQGASNAVDVSRIEQFFSSYRLAPLPAATFDERFVVEIVGPTVASASPRVLSYNVGATLKYMLIMKRGRCTRDTMNEMFGALHEAQDNVAPSLKIARRLIAAHMPLVPVRRCAVSQQPYRDPIDLIVSVLRAVSAFVLVDRAADFTKH